MVMGRYPVEIILMRQLASYLAVPILIVDRNLDLLFFNESAEPILGCRFDETGEVRRGEWTRLFRPTDTDGSLIPREQQPLALAVDRKEPSHQRFCLTGLDGVARVIEGLGLPLETREEGLLGAAGIFWEVRASQSAVVLETPPTEHGCGHSRHQVEVILLRRLADRLTMPTIVIDAAGRLLFYNQPAEPLIGRSFAELGEIELRDWYEVFQPTALDGSTIKREEHPMVIALRDGQPISRPFWFRGLDGVRRGVEGAAFPLVGQWDRPLGAVGFFWERLE